MGLFDSIGKSISDASQGAIQKGKDIADSAKMSSMISEEEKKISSNFLTLGMKYFEECGDNPSETLAELVNNIRESKAKIAELEEKIKDLKGVGKCPSCGADVAKGAAFCPSCGAKQPVPEVKGRVCPGCGNVVGDDVKFCPTCGSAIEQ